MKILRIENSVTVFYKPHVWTNYVHGHEKKIKTMDGNFKNEHKHIPVSPSPLFKGENKHLD